MPTMYHTINSSSYNENVIIIVIALNIIVTVTFCNHRLVVE